MADRIKVVIADDHPVVRRGLKAVISTQDDLEVIGEAEDGETAVRLARDLRPDVILMDLIMPRMGGLDAISKIRTTDPAARIVVLTSFGEDEHVLAALRAGASGFHLKDSPPEQLLNGIREVYHGQISLHAAATQAVVAQLKGKASVNDPRDRLSKREAEVLSMLGEGLSNAEIALRLSLREHTVAKHVSRILEKLEVANRTQAALLAANGGQQTWR